MSNKTTLYIQHSCQQLLLQQSKYINVNIITKSLKLLILKDLVTCSISIENEIKTDEDEKRFVPLEIICYKCNEIRLEIKCPYFVDHLYITMPIINTYNIIKSQSNVISTITINLTFSEDCSNLKNYNFSKLKNIKFVSSKHLVSKNILFLLEFLTFNNFPLLSNIYMDFPEGWFLIEKELFTKFVTLICNRNIFVYIKTHSLDSWYKILCVINNMVNINCTMILDMSKLWNEQEISKIIFEILLLFKKSFNGNIYLKFSNSTNVIKCSENLKNLFGINFNPLTVGGIDCNKTECVYYKAPFDPKKENMKLNFEDDELNCLTTRFFNNFSILSSL